MHVLLHFLRCLGNLPQGKGISLPFLHPFHYYLLSLVLGYSFLVFQCNAISLPPLLEFETAHAVGDVAIPTLTFPFPLTSPSDILLGKELRHMALPAKSWPRASEDWISWVDRLSPYFQGHWESLSIA